MSLTAQARQFLEDLDPKVRAALLFILEEMEKDRRERGADEDFREIKEAIRDLTANVARLAQAHLQSEARLTRVEKVLEELAEAQARTERRLEELAEAQRQAEARLTRVEKVLEELAEAQARTERRLEELAEAQARTERRLEELIQEHKKTREHLGGLSHAFGYRLEDEAIWALPGLLKRDFGIEVQGTLRRGFIELAADRFMEVNIWGEAVRDGKPVVVFGEAKTQLRKEHVTEFLKRVQKAGAAVNRDVFPVLVTYHAPPQVCRFVREQGVALYFSFELR